MTTRFSGSGASGALLRVQRALVIRFADYVGGAAGMQEAFSRYGLRPLDPLPHPVLYDEPRSGMSSYFRLGNASVDVETGSGRLLWSIDQEIEAHADPVRGRAVALAMGDLIELAFAPRRPEHDPVDHPHSGTGVYLESWLTEVALTLPADPNDPAAVATLPLMRVTDMVQTDSRIGYSEAGLTYQVVTTWNIIAEPL